MASRDVPQECMRSAQAASQSLDFSLYGINTYPKPPAEGSTKTGEDAQQPDQNDEANAQEEKKEDEALTKLDIIEKGDDNNNDRVEE